MPVASGRKRGHFLGTTKPDCRCQLISWLNCGHEKGSAFGRDLRSGGSLILLNEVLPVHSSCGARCLWSRLVTSRLPVQVVSLLNVLMTMTPDCRCAIICGSSTTDDHRGRMFLNAVGVSLLLRQKAFPVWIRVAFG